MGHADRAVDSKVRAVARIESVLTLQSQDFGAYNGAEVCEGGMVDKVFGLEVLRSVRRVPEFQPEHWHTLVVLQVSS